MVITEQNTNFPSSLGRINKPKTKSWGVNRIAGLPSVRGIGRQPSIMPQISVEREEAIDVHNVMAKQLTSKPVFPFFDRPAPILEYVKGRAPLLPRTKLLGTLGLLDPQRFEYPTKYRWGEGREISGLPSVMGIISGPNRTLHPSISVEW